MKGCAVEKNNVALTRQYAKTLWRRLRRWMKKRAFITALVLPTVLAFFYFLMLASPMYVSHASFAIRSADASVSGGADIASMFLRTSGSTGNDAYIINDYIQSLDLAQDIDGELGLVSHYSDREYDVISRLWQHPTQDELTRYWRWAVLPQLNVDTGIISLEVKAYTPEMAQKLTQAILKRSEVLVNAMNERARHDAVELAREEVSRAEERVRHAQSAMREFRDTHNLIDPKSTAAGLQELVTRLEAEATTLRTQISEAKSYMNAEAPLLKSLNQRLVLKKNLPLRIVSEATTLPTRPSVKNRETRVPSFTPFTSPSIVYSCCACEARQLNKKRLLNSSFFIIKILEVIIGHKVELFFIECFSFYYSLILM